MQNRSLDLEHGDHIEIPPVCVGGGIWGMTEATRSNSDEEEAGPNGIAPGAPPYVWALLTTSLSYPEQVALL